jgi:hypothetical protein
MSSNGTTKHMKNASKSKRSSFEGALRVFEPCLVKAHDPAHALTLLDGIVKDDYLGIRMWEDTCGDHPSSDIPKTGSVWSVVDTVGFKTRFTRMVDVGVPVIDAFKMAFSVTCAHDHAYTASGSVQDGDDVRDRFLQRVCDALSRRLLDAFIASWDTDAVLGITACGPYDLRNLPEHVRAIIMEQDDKQRPIFTDQDIPVSRGGKRLVDGLRICVPAKDWTLPNEESSLIRHDPAIRSLILVKDVSSRSLVGNAHDAYASVMIPDMTLPARIMGRPLTEDEQTQHALDILSAWGDRHLMIRLPDFNPSSRPFPGKPEIYSDFRALMAHRRFFESGIRLIARLADPSKTSIVLPMIESPEEFDIWKSVIDAIYLRERDCSVPIGIMVDSEPLLEQATMFSGADFLVLDIDGITTDIMGDAGLPAVMETLKTDVRDAHQMFRERDIIHYLGGRALAHPRVVDRALKMGFTRIIVPPGHVPEALETIDRHLSNKDRFVGVHRRRLEQKGYSGSRDR